MDTFEPVVLAVRIPRHLRAAVKALATARGITLAELVEGILTEAVREGGAEIAALPGRIMDAARARKQQPPA